MQGSMAFETSQKSKFRAFTRESIDHGISIVKASELPNQVVVDAFVHGDRGARTVSGAAEVRAEVVVADSLDAFQYSSRKPHNHCSL